MVALNQLVMIKIYEKFIANFVYNFIIFILFYASIYYFYLYLILYIEKKLQFSPEQHKLPPSRALNSVLYTKLFLIFYDNQNDC